MKLVISLLCLMLGAGPALAQGQPAPGQPGRGHAAPAAQPAAAPPPVAAPAGGPSNADIAAAVTALRDDAKRAELIRMLEALAAARGQPVPAAPAPAAAPAAAPVAPSPAPAAAPATPGSTTPEASDPLSFLSARIGEAVNRIIDTIKIAADLPAVLQWFSDALTDDLTRARILGLAWKLLLVFGAGIAAEMLATRLLRRWTERLDAATPPEHVRHAFLRRLPYIAVRLLLDLIPVVAFGVVAKVAISLLPGWPSQRFIMWTVARAYLYARGFMVIVRLVFSPASNHLRLLPCADETAAYATVWLRRIALVIVIAYASSEFALLLGLPRGVQSGLFRTGLLFASIFFVIVVLQNKLGVAQFLAAPPLKPTDHPDRARRLLRLVRDRLADIWHILAILWIVALWGGWALNIDHGFERLLRASFFTLIVLSIAKGLDEGARRLIRRAFRISPDLARRYPGLEARANRYLPALRGTVGGAIAFATLIVLLEIWGLGAFSWFGEGKIGSRVLSSVVSVLLTLAVSLTVWEAANSAIQRHLVKLSADAATARSARVRTLLPMLRTAFAVVVLVTAGLTILSEVGVNVAPLLAGAGVIGLAVGFGSQTLVRDVITGIFLLFEDAVAVGDTVTLGGLSGTVEQLSIRSIRLRALDGSIHIVPFSAVTTVTNQTRDYGYAVLDLGVDYGEDVERVSEALKQVSNDLRQDEKFGSFILAPIEIMGVDKLVDAGVILRSRLKTEPAKRWAVLRELNLRVKRYCEENGIGLMVAPKPAAPVQFVMAPNQEQDPFKPA
jgi:small-conductance mechanosensitive channel